MNFIETIKERARQEIKTIVLPEAEDIRTLKAAEVALKEKYANIILVGNEKNIKEKAEANNVNIEGAKIIEPQPIHTSSSIYIYIYFLVYTSLKIHRNISSCYIMIRSNNCYIGSHHNIFSTIIK